MQKHHYTTGTHPLGEPGKMRWADLPWPLKFWFAAQIVGIAAVFCFSPFGALLVGLFCWFVLRPVMQAPEAPPPPPPPPPVRPPL